ncbi:MAG: EAL domain-containing protein [Ruminiclostridium sp.]|nr:EAL domain-containing protein [Ruminiclostridium sp.]
MSLSINKTNAEEMIRKAAENKEIKVFYQPKFDSINGKAVGAEALARWIKADGTVVPPSEFVPVLEETGYITILDWYMLEEVCAFLKNRIDRGEKTVTVSVNFSRLQTAEPDYIERLCRTVDSYSVPHDTVEVEITESAMACDGNDIKVMITKIKDTRDYR